MVVSAEPLASQAGMQTLRAGGNAVDAAVVTALALAVTLPRAGNLGGGGFLLVRSPEGKVYALDFREKAPAAATRTMYVGADGKADNDKATIGALSVGVPGTVAGMDEALRRFGTMTLAQAAAPAQRLAADGFVVPGWLTPEVLRVKKLLTTHGGDGARIFFPNDQPIAAGSVWKQPELAATLKSVQEHGAPGFYSGPVADKLVASVQRHGGILTAADLAAYKAVWREPVHCVYRGYDVDSMPAPSSGGIHLVEALQVLQGYDLAAAGHNSALNLHRLTETLRQCYADRSKWLGDPDFIKMPVAWLTSKAYADQIRAQIPDHQARRSADVQPGTPPPHESPETTHFCVVDDKGWAVSLTYTLNFSYGSGIVAEGTGVLLNDEMGDFSAAPGQPNAFGLLGGEANAVAPHRRPLSTMTPTILQKDGKFVAAIGSPGGSRILTVVLQVVLNLIDFDLNAQTAVADSRMHHQWYPDQLELEEGFSPDTIALLKSWGHNVVRADSIGHAMIIRRSADGTLEAGADPRRTGGASAGY